MARGATRAARRRRGRAPAPAPRRIGTTPRAAFGPAVGLGMPGDVPAPSVEGADVAPFRAPGVNDDPGQPTAVWLPTSALLKMVELARDEDLELQLDPGLDADVDAHGTHLLHNLTRVTAPDGVDFVRCFARVLLTEGREYEVFLDLPTRYVGMLVEASRPREAPKIVVGHEPPPRWAGSWSFARAYASADSLAVGSTARDPHPREVVAADALWLLRESHVLVVDPEQVAVLPDWEGWENLWDYTADCALPFEQLYLDLEGPGAVCPRMSVGVGWKNAETGEVHEADTKAFGTIRGALLHRLSYPAAEAGLIGGELGGRLAVDPIGEMWYQGEEQPEPRYEIMGRAIFNAAEPEGEPGFLGRAPLRWYGPDGLREATGACVRTTDITGEDTPGFAVVPLSEAEVTGSEEGQWQARAQAAVILSCASRVMAALSITESEAVVIDQADLPTRDRRRAEKRGWPIADKVFIRPTRKGGERNVTGEEAHYSHRFWVRGHTKHFPLGTRIADARPDLVHPCTRTGDASCGYCRRVWTPPFIKGPEDQPLVLKSLVKRRDS